MIGDILTLQLANLRIVEGDIVLEVIAVDQAVISDNGYALRLRGCNDGGGFNAVGGGKEQDAVAIGRVGLGLRLLEVRVTLSIVVIDMRAWKLLRNILFQEGFVFAVPAG